MFIAWSCVSLVILNDHYPGKLIGHGGPVPQPPRSPDLTPVELLLWDLVRYAVGLFPISNNIEHYPGKLIGRGGPIPQPPRSPDLIPPPPPPPSSRYGISWVMSSVCLLCLTALKIWSFGLHKPCKKLTIWTEVGNRWVMSCYERTTEIWGCTNVH
jgi:hypothetical protein